MRVYRWVNLYEGGEKRKYYFSFLEVISIKLKVKYKANFRAIHFKVINQEIII